MPRRKTPAHIIAPVIKRIKQVRVERGLSQKSFSERIGYSKAYIGEIERLRDNPPAPTSQYIIAICKAFDVSADFLLLGRDDPPAQVIKDALRSVVMALESQRLTMDFLADAERKARLAMEAIERKGK